MLIFNKVKIASIILLIILSQATFAADSDGDGFEDGVDNCPTDYDLSNINTDGDIWCDTNDVDDDNDGVADVVDAAPLDARNSTEIDLPLDTTYKGNHLSELFQLSETTTINYPYSGKLTYYPGNLNGGACGYVESVYFSSASFPFDYYAAAGSDVFKNGENCGMVVEITNASVHGVNPSCETTNATIKVLITDQCPECDNAWLDLTPEPFAELVGPGLSDTCGIIDADWRFIAGEFTSNIQIHSKSGTSAWWYGFRFYNHNLPVTKVELKSSGSSTWHEADKSESPSFYKLIGGYPLTAPLSVRFTDVNGNVTTAHDVITNLNGDTYFDTGTQFSGELVGDPLQ